MLQRGIVGFHSVQAIPQNLSLVTAALALQQAPEAHRGEKDFRALENGKKKVAAGTESLCNDRFV